MIKTPSIAEQQDNKVPKSKIISSKRYCEKPSWYHCFVSVSTPNSRRLPSSLYKNVGRKETTIMKSPNTTTLH